jgi:hypothetical protein
VPNKLYTYSFIIIALPSLKLSRDPASSSNPGEHHFFHQGYSQSSAISQASIAETSDSTPILGHFPVSACQLQTGPVLGLLRSDPSSSHTEYIRVLDPTGTIPAQRCDEHPQLYQYSNLFLSTYPVSVLACAHDSVNSLLHSLCSLTLRE